MSGLKKCDNLGTVILSTKLGSAVKHGKNMKSGCQRSADGPSTLSRYGIQTPEDKQIWEVVGKDEGIKSVLASERGI
jgi:hypothetical protein